MLIFGRRHLERVLAEYVVHYNEHRPHRGQDQLAPLTLVAPPHISEPKRAQLRRRDAVSGLTHEFRLAA